MFLRRRYLLTKKQRERHSAANPTHVKQPKTLMPLGLECELLGGKKSIIALGLAKPLVPLWPSQANKPLLSSELVMIVVCCERVRSLLSGHRG